MRKIKVGIIQQANTADLRTNLMNLAKSIEACAAHGAQLVVLQELHNSLYFCQTENTQLFDLAETIPGPSTGFYSELAAANKIVLVTSLFEKRAPGLYHNTAVVFDRDGSIAGKYRKMHIPDDPAYYEKFYFTPGDIGFEPIQTSLGKLAVLVCWDQIIHLEYIAKMLSPVLCQRLLIHINCFFPIDRYITAVGIIDSAYDIQ